MRLGYFGLGFSLSLAALASIGCSATSAKPTGATGAGGAGGTSATSGGGNGGGFTTGPGSGGSGGSESCATFSAAAKQATAAMLFVLDRSASMSQQGKWGTAQLAVAQAIDKDAFDTMSIGLTVFPAGYVPAPDCLCPGFGGTCGGILPNGVACGASILPQVALAPAGTMKANAATGVRHLMYDWLVQHTPETQDPSDASPIYDSLAGAYGALKGYNVEKRIAVLITDGGFSCTSVAVNKRPGYSDGACDDWEYPDTVNTLINGARLDAQKPINTFIVGVPGSNSHDGEKQGPYAVAPYSMLLALSNYAVNGSPDTIDPACDKDKVFTKNGMDPGKPCHLDLSNGANFNPDGLANAITAIRGKALGCLYTLPDPPPGKTIDLGLVNVVVTIGGVKATIPKRTAPADTCANDGCWDYTGTQVQLLGKTCADVGAATDAKVDITVGCATILK